MIQCTKLKVQVNSMCDLTDLKNLTELFCYSLKSHASMAVVLCSVYGDSITDLPRW